MRYVLAFSSLFCLACTGAFGAVDSGLLAMTPPGAKMITSVDVQHARASPFGQYILNRINTEDAHFQELAQDTGFDPRRDLQDFVFASTGSETERDELQFAIIARGFFDVDRIKKAAKAKGAVVQSYLGVDLILDSSTHRKTGLAFPEVGVAVLGDLATLRQIVANRANPTALDPALQRMISKVGGENDAWFVSTSSSSFLERHLREETKQPIQQAQALESIRESSGGIRFGDDVRLSFEAITRSPQDASSLADVVRFAASMIQLERQKDARAGILASALDQMDLRTNGTSMHLSISIPEKSMEQLAEIHNGPGRPNRHPAQ